MEQLTRNNSFIKKIYTKYMVSSILAMLATSVGSLVDTALVGMFMGENGLAAMSLVSPVYLIYYTIGAVIGIGGSIAANLYIGKNDYEGYRRVFSLTFYLTLALALATTLLGMLFTPQIAGLLGGSGEPLRLAQQYLRWYIPGGWATLLVYIPLYFLKTEGRPQLSTRLFLITTVVNILLTALFMSDAVGMGIGGAAAATGISMAITALIGCGVLLFGRTETRLVRGCFSPGALRSVLRCGAPSGLDNLCSALRVVIINYIIISVGAAAMLPTYSLVRSVSDLMTGIMLGIASATLPIIGVYYSERDNKNVRSVFSSALRIGGVCVLALSVLTALAPDFFSAVFNITDPVARAESRTALVMLAISLLLAFFNIMLTGFFSTTEKPWLSNLIVIMRLIVYTVIPAAALCGALGIRAVWLSFIIAEALTLVTTLVVMRQRSAARGLDRLLLDTTHEGEGELSFSVKNDLADVMNASDKMSEFCDENEVDARRAMTLSLALEEMLTVIINKCLGDESESFIDVRIKLLGDDIMIRIRSTGRLFDPVKYYEENKDDEQLADELMGIKMILGKTQFVDFRETFGVNNLLIMF